MQFVELIAKPRQATTDVLIREESAKSLTFSHGRGASLNQHSVRLVLEGVRGQVDGVEMGAGHVTNCPYEQNREINDAMKR